MTKFIHAFEKQIKVLGIDTYDMQQMKDNVDIRYGFLIVGTISQNW